LIKNYSPLVVGWSLLDKCNLNCEYCDTNSYSKKVLPKKDVFKIIDQLKFSGCERISFSGGEPLLVDYIGEIVDYSKEKGIKVGINTNGFFLEKKINEIKNVDILTISLDGDERTHDSLRGKGTYKKVIDAIRIAKNHDIGLALTCVITKKNIDKVEYLASFAKKENIAIYFQPVTFLPLGSKEYRAMCPDEDVFKKTINDLIRYKKKNKFIGNSYPGLKYLLNWPNYKFIPCSAGKIYCAIDSVGNLFSCSNLRHINKGVNILKYGFKQAFLDIERTGCKNCWCSSQVELNYIYSLNPEAIISASINQL